MRLLRSLREDRKARYAHGWNSERQCKTACRRHPDPYACEGSGTDRHRNPVDIGQSLAAFGKGFVDEGHQLFGMSPADICTGRGQNDVAFAVINSGKTTRSGRIERKNDHGCNRALGCMDCMIDQTASTA